MGGLGRRLQFVFSLWHLKAQHLPSGILKAKKISERASLKNSASLKVNYPFLLELNSFKLIYMSQRSSQEFRILLQGSQNAVLCVKMGNKILSRSVAKFTEHICDIVVM